MRAYSICLSAKLPSLFSYSSRDKISMLLSGVRNSCDMLEEIRIYICWKAQILRFLADIALRFAPIRRPRAIGAAAALRRSSVQLFIGLPQFFHLLPEFFFRRPQW